MRAASPASPLDPFLRQPVVVSTRFLDRLQHLDWSGLTAEWGLRLGGSFLLLLAGLWLSKWLARLITQVLVRFGQERILTSFLANIVRAIVMVIVFIAALEFLGVPTNSLLAVVGAAGLGIGLALKDSLSNIASGVMLIALRPFRAGDEVQVATLNGVVDQVRIFQTVLRSYDNRVIILPNSLITAAPITNFTARDRRRIDLTLGIGYGDDIRVARELLIAAARANPRVHADPAPEVLVAALAENRVDIVLRVWVGTRDFAIAKSELLEAAHGALGDGGVRVPHGLHVFHHDVGDTPEAGQRIESAVRDRAAGPQPVTGPEAKQDAAAAEGTHTPES